MDNQTQQKVYSFLRERIARTPELMRMYTINGSTGNIRPNRNAFVRLRKYACDFMSNSSGAQRLIILSGLRGSGKTTLFMQILSELQNIPDTHKLFISLDAVQSLGLSLTDVLAVYERDILGTPFESLKDPVFLFLDEVQYDDGWALSLKTVYDRTNKVCIFATGSSALALQGGRVGADIARRAKYEHLFPMSFTEYMKIKHDKFEEKGLGEGIREIFTESKSAVEFFERANQLSNLTDKYMSNIDPLVTMDYFKYGSLPFILSENTDQEVSDRINQVLEKIIRNDLAKIGGFDTQTISRIPELLYLVAHSDKISVYNIGDKLGISHPTVANILATLKKCETLLRIRPYGSVSGQVRKSSKYTFMASSVRAALFQRFGTTLSEEIYKGKLLEDVVALYLHRVFAHTGIGLLLYDVEKGGADFVLTTRNQCIVIEVGFGKRTPSRCGKQCGKSRKIVLVSPSLPVP